MTTFEHPASHPDQATPSSPPTGPLPPGTARPRRLRRTEPIRGLVRETVLPPSRLVLPIFLTDANENAREPIDAMPGVSRHGLNDAIAFAREAMTLGIRSFALFPKIEAEKKTPDGAEAFNADNLICRAIRRFRESLSDACLITDVALDPFSSLGHDGVVENGEILNDATVDALCRQSLVQAEAGADMVAPSDMMDGRVGAIRRTLDQHGFEHVAILSYTAKYASSFYGPFRAALDSAPAAAHDVPRDKKTYQMDPANAREAMTEARLDIDESADILMVKPALPYLDIIAWLRSAFDGPIAAYHVSGEYAMIKAAGERGWLDAEPAMIESILACARAGADIVFTYAAVEYATWWHDQHGMPVNR